MRTITRRSACRLGALALLSASCPALKACASPDPAQTSAQALMFSDALGQDFAEAVKVMAEKADDAKLMAVRSASFAAAETTPSWMYLFYSWERALAYTVFVAGGTASPGETGSLAITEDEFARVPLPDVIAIDAAAAYQKVLAEIAGDEELLTCRAHLMMYDEAGEDELVWVFSFNEEDDVEAYLGAVEPLNPVAAEQLWTVDAQSGAVYRG